MKLYAIAHNSMDVTIVDYEKTDASAPWEYAQAIVDSAYTNLFKLSSRGNIEFCVHTRLKAMMTMKYGHHDGAINPVAAALMLGYGYDNLKNAWHPTGTTLITGPPTAFDLAEKTSDTPVTELYESLTHDQVARIIAIRDLAKTLGGDTPEVMNKYATWVKFNPSATWRQVANAHMQVQVDADNPLEVFE